VTRRQAAGLKPFGRPTHPKSPVFLSIDMRDLTQAGAWQTPATASGGLHDSLRQG
jgi:hypothetical protein